MKAITNITHSALALFVFACFALSPTAQAQLSPPPDGGHSNDNIAAGQDALFSLDTSTGISNTAVPCALGKVSNWILN